MKSEWMACLASLRREVVPALGCTDPVAIALAAANAAEALGRKPDRLELTLSRNMLKNAMAVGIPGSGGASGVDVAAALGAFGGDPRAGLETLRGIDEATAAAARRFVAEVGVPVTLAGGDEPLYIEARASAGGDSARAVISGDYARLVLVELNGEPFASSPGVSDTELASERSSEATTGTEAPSLESIFGFASEAPFSELAFMLEAAAVNGALAQAGLEGEWGLRVGRTLAGHISPDGGDTDGAIDFQALAAEASALTAAAVDARMAGCPLPAMTNSGSGNQGVTATMPVVAAARRVRAEDEALARALALSHLSAIRIRSRWDRLSAMCGTIAAATGAACGIAFLLGGGMPEIRAAVATMAGDLSGMLCDGAKPGCALKASSAAQSAVKAAMLAIRGIRPDGRQGLVDDDAEKTIVNLGRLSSEGLRAADAMALDIMLEKAGRKPA